MLGSSTLIPTVMSFPADPYRHPLNDHPYFYHLLATQYLQPDMPLDLDSFDDAATLTRYNTEPNLSTDSKAFSADPSSPTSASRGEGLVLNLGGRRRSSKASLSSSVQSLRVLTGGGTTQEPDPNLRTGAQRHWALVQGHAMRRQSAPLSQRAVAFASKACGALYDWCVKQMELAELLRNHGPSLRRAVVCPRRLCPFTPHHTTPRHATPHHTCHTTQHHINTPPLRVLEQVPAPRHWVARS